MHPKSILKKLQFYMLSFGVMMGFVFPVYAGFFVNWKEGMFYWFLSGCIGAGITVGLVSFAFVKIILIKNLKKIAFVAEDLSKKKLPKPIDLQSNDEVGIIINGMNTSIDGFKVLLHEISKIVSYSRGILKQVKAGNGQRQTTSIHQLDDALRSVNAISSELERISSNASQLVAKGISSNDQASNNLMLTYRTIKEYRERINEIVTHSQTIRDAVRMIDDIAVKTNILSLNASIEAKSVGEAGKGFSVVAAEVQKLSVQTVHSARQIAERVEDMQFSLNKMQEVMDDITSRVRNNSEDVQRTNKDLLTIQEGVEFNQSHSQELKAATDNLSDLFHDVKGAFNQLHEQVDNLSGEINQYQ